MGSTALSSIPTGTEVILYSAVEMHNTFKNESGVHRKLSMSCGFFGCGSDIKRHSAFLQVVSSVLRPLRSYDLPSYADASSLSSQWPSDAFCSVRRSILPHEVCDCRADVAQDLVDVSNLFTIWMSKRTVLLGEIMNETSKKSLDIYEINARKIRKISFYVQEDSGT